MSHKFCKSTGYVLVNGADVLLVEGRAYDAADPAVKVYPHLFRDTPVVYSSQGEVVVEQATAAPGEKRAAKRAR